jgi:glycosyltransferase involved in cell wall biosynthesis
VEHIVKVLWVGDSPTVSTGFARCTAAACSALHAAGHEVHVLGLNYWGDPHGFPYLIYPCRQPFEGGRDGFGVGRLPRLAAQLRPDLIVLLNDPWNVPAYLAVLKESEIDIPVAGWLAVDSKNQRGDGLNGLAHVVTWTRFAAEELRRGGYQGTPSVVPLGVDSDLFRPHDRTGARKAIFPASVPADAYIVGVVGRNQPRKRLDLTLSHFAAWLRAHPHGDAYLYLHVAPTGESGTNIRSLVVYYGLTGRVLIGEPHIGTGIEDGQMPLVYSALDCYLTTTQGEGWGLPCIEAMACGLPCVVPDWSALGEWTKDAALRVPCTSTALTAPLNDLAYTLGGVVDEAGTVEALERLYTEPDLRAKLRDRGLALARSLPWSAAGEGMREVLESVVAAPALAAEGA